MEDWPVASSSYEERKPEPSFSDRDNKGVNTLSIFTRISFQVRRGRRHYLSRLNSDEGAKSNDLEVNVNVVLNRNVTRSPSSRREHQVSLYTLHKLISFLLHNIWSSTATGDKGMGRVPEGDPEF